jgi:hypothetical protein
MTLTAGKLILAKDYRSFNPSDIETALWLDAADASTITESGGAVSQWNDKSGNNFNASQGTSAERPTYVTNAVGNKNALLFDGVDDFVVVAHNNLLNMQLDPSAVFCVYKQDVSGTGFRLFQKDDGAGTFADSLFGSPQNFTSVAGAFGDSYSPAYTPGDVAIQSFTWDGSLITNWLDGTLATPGTVFNGTIVGGSIDPTNTPAANTDDLYIAKRNNPGFSEGNFQGYICEIIFSNLNLSTIERQKVEGYLAHKWGLTANLPADHPYKTVEPTP